MQFEIDVNGRTRVVTIDKASPDGRRLQVTVDGRPRLVDVAQTAPGGLSLVFVDDGRASWQVAISEGDAPGELAAHLRSGTIPVLVNGRARRRGRAAAAAGGQRRVVAPMPGRVVRVLARPGDEVEARQPLVVVEAMKMENELSSPKAGRVVDLPVREGMSVEAGRVLAIVE